jgi:hypothetical protein
MPRNQSQKENRRIYKTVGMLPHEWELFETLRAAKNDATPPEDKLTTKNLLLQLIHNWMWMVNSDYKRLPENQRKNGCPEENIEDYKLPPFGSKGIKHVSLD